MDVKIIHAEENIVSDGLILSDGGASVFRMTNPRVVFALTCLIIFGCQAHSLESDFFDTPIASRVEHFRRYSLADQYKIFRYGMDRIEPPYMGLAEPIAERGAAAMPFLLDRLNSKPDDITVRDILLIFDTMATSKSYEVKSDAELMATLKSRVSGMKEHGWQDVCSKQLQRIKDAR
jgi:hypothetical protein